MRAAIAPAVVEYDGSKSVEHCKASVSCDGKRRPRYGRANPYCGNRIGQEEKGYKKMFGDSQM